MCNLLDGGRFKPPEALRERIVGAGIGVPRGEPRDSEVSKSMVAGASLFFAALLFVAPPGFCQGSTQPPPQPQMQPQATSPPVQAPQSDGIITGSVIDGTGAALVGAKVKLTRDDHSLDRDTVSDGNGQFIFTAVAPGTFQISITAAGFAAQVSSGKIEAGESHVVPPITLAIATEVTQVRVGLSHEEVVEMAQEEIKEEEKQRVLGVIPNFYVSYVPDAAPLTPKQKFQLAFRSVIDPATFFITGAAAGIEQADNQFSGFGVGAAGYGKRYGAAYADNVTSTFLGGAVLPSLLHQDPRYFYKGTGSIKSRILYAIANAVICKGDNRHWQPNYSEIVGGFAAAAISNLYYPSQNRNGLDLTFENTAIGIGSVAAANILQEFVVRKFTPNLPGNHSNKAANTVSEIWTTITHEGR